MTVACFLRTEGGRRQEDQHHPAEARSRRPVRHHCGSGVLLRRHQRHLRARTDQ